MKKLLGIILTAFSVNAVSATDPQTAYEMSQKKAAVLIDVRENDEIKSGMIKDAKWFPLSKISSEKDWIKDFLEITEGKKIFLYCRSGARSQKVMDILKSKGIDTENIGGYETLKQQLPSVVPLKKKQ